MPHAPRNPVPFLRAIGLAEAASFLVLLFVAMPLKYAAGIAMAVKVAGWIHGVLFIALCGALVRTMVVARWPASRGVLVLVAALVPFGPIVIDRRMKGYEGEFVSARPTRGESGSSPSAQTPA